MDNEDRKAENKKLIMWALIVLVVLVLVIIIGPVIGNLSSEHTADSPLDTGLQEDDSEQPAYSVAYPEVDDIRELIGEGAMSSMLSSVQNVILMKDEIAAATQKNQPKNGYNETVFVATASCSRCTGEIVFPYTVHSMFFETSDGRQYLARTTTPNDKYYATAVSRVVPSDGPIYLYITVDDYESDHDAIINGFIDWAKDIYPDEGIIVTTGS